MAQAMELVSRSAAACWQSRSILCSPSLAAPVDSGRACTKRFCRRSVLPVRRLSSRNRLRQISCSISSFDDSSGTGMASKLVSDTVPEDGKFASRSSSNGNLDSAYAPDVDRDGGSGSGDHNGNNGSGGGEEDGGGGGSHYDDEQFGPLLNVEQVQQEIQVRGITLPPDMLEAAKTVGIRKLFLDRFLELQGGLLGKAMSASSALRNRMLADPTFLFKVFTEIAIDSGCATFAEVQKRGKDFWHEFDFYLADLMVGIALDVLLVGLLAPVVRFGAAPAGKGATAKLSRAIQALPSSMFEAERPGRTFSMEQRISTLFYKAGQYGVAGFSCGLLGQGIASSVMILKRKLRNADDHSEELKVPNVLATAALWAVFMGVSSNTRYQIINGLERVVESSMLTKRVPQVAYAFTVGIRLANNFYGGLQFVDWARQAGVQ